MNERITEDDPRLTAYALGEMEENERQEFERLLARDAGARSRVDEIRATAAFLETALEREPVVAAPVRTRAQGKGPIIKFPQFYYIVSGLAAACFALFFMIDQAKEAAVERDRPAVVKHVPRADGIRQQPEGAIPMLPAANAALSERFHSTVESTTSTFPLRVGAESYARVANALRRGEKPRREQVHVAEMINAFSYSWPKPASGEQFATVLEAAPAPWAPENRLVRIGIKGDGAADTLLARDAHVQVDFNSDFVSAWRLIGFERNGEAGVRGLSSGDNLRGDAVVTALYEVKPRDGRGTGNAPWLTLNLRYVDAGSGAVKTLAAQLSRVAPSFEQASQDFHFIASVAAFGFMLKGTPMERAIAPDELTRWARTSVQGRPEREQFLGLVEMARAL